MTELDNRVVRLETEMAEVREIAQAANREVSHVPDVLRGHTRLLNTLRKTQREHSERFDRLEDRFDRLEDRFNGLEERFNHLEDKVDHGFGKIRNGMAHITDLLNRAIKQSD